MIRGALIVSAAVALAATCLRRLRLKGLIFRPPRVHRYFLTPRGWKVARLMTRLEARVFRPALAAFEERPAALPPQLSRTGLFVQFTIHSS